MKRIVAALVSGLMGMGMGCATEDAGSWWPRFRGPDGAGVGDAAKVPEKLDAAQVRWDVALPGGGHSSPVVWGSRVFLACEDEAARRRCIVALDAGTGEVLWTLWREYQRQRIHPDNSFAAATPAVDGDALYMAWVTDGQVEAFALDHDGSELWQRRLGAFRATHGPGASPVVVGDVMIVTNDQGSDDAAVHGLDRKTGESVWKIARDSGLPSYATPSVYRDDAGRRRLLLASPAHGFTSIDPSTGREDWSLAGVFRLNVVASPVIAGDRVLGSSGRGGAREAVVARIAAPGGPAIDYRPAKNIPYVPTPVVVGDHAFVWDDFGTVTCLEVATGDVAWSRRVTGPTYTSPVTDGRRVFGISRKGEMVVVAAKPEFEELDRFQLPEGTHATPALAHGSMFLRTFGRLLRVGS